MDCFAALAMTTRGIRDAKAGCDAIVGAGEALPPCGPASDGHLCHWRWRLCADARRELRTEPAGDGGAVGTANRSRMPSPRVVIQQQPRLIGRIVVAQQLLQRRFIEPFFFRHVVRFRLKRCDARWIRLVCTRIHVAFFRRRLMAGRYLAPHDAVKRSHFRLRAFDENVSMAVSLHLSRTDP